MAALFGLSTTEDFKNERFKSVRRKVFYDYPNGAAPLIGLSSLMKEEPCSDPEFFWYEKRLAQQFSTTSAVSGGNGPFAGSAGGVTPNEWGSTLRTGGAGIDAGGAAVKDHKLSIKVADTTQFRIDHVVAIENLTMNAGNAQRLVARVAGYNATGPNTTQTTNPKAAGFLDLILLQGTVTNGYKNNGSTLNNGLVIRVVGSQYAQGAIGSTISVHNLPVNPKNYTQIFRAKFGMTGTALKTPVKWDDTGAYRDKAKEASINHMIEMEKAAIFGTQYSTASGSDPEGITYASGGILWFLEQWELGTPYGVTASTADTDDNKRIIENTSGDLSEKKYDGFLERAFRVTNNKANEKLVLCGNQFLNVINQMYKSKSVIDGGMPVEGTYGMDVVKHRTPFGTLFYKTHPLFNQDPTLRSWGLILDVGNLVYRYIEGRDTQLLTDRQANDEDRRVDEWLTECGFEVRFPESHMLLKNVIDYTP